METATTEFETFLRKKGIAHTDFQKADPKLFDDLVHAFQAGGTSHLELRKKFLWNDLRLEFPLAKETLPED